MLGKTKIPENDTPVNVTKTQEVKPAAEPSPRPNTSVSREEKTVIGEHISIEGLIKGQEHLVIEGALKGNVEMDKYNFTVGSSGRVDGEIRAQDVNISGQLKGSINSLGKVNITKEADFFGDVKAKSISVEDGAYFKGSIELEREPHRKPDPAAAPKVSSSPAAGKATVSPPTGIKKES